MVLRLCGVGRVELAESFNLFRVQAAAVNAHVAHVAVEKDAIVALRADEERAVAAGPRHNAVKCLDLAAVHVEVQLAEGLVETPPRRDCGRRLPAARLNFFLLSAYFSASPGTYFCG